MRRLSALVAAMLLIPALPAGATELGDLLDRAKDAEYTAEQVISCSTPDGVRDAVVSIEQTGGELHVGAPVSGDVEVASGSGGWALMRDGSVVDSATVTSGSDDTGATYRVEGGPGEPYLDREASRYQLFDGDLLRAELVVDSESGALLGVVTYNRDGTVYCERRFIDFDPTAPEEAVSTLDAGVALEPSEAGAAFPDGLGAFARLDIYEDTDGLVFAYYSDGFFSFAVFQTPTVVVLDDPVPMTAGEGTYSREFSPGQVTISWETRDGGMALVGDLPPDLQTVVLEGLAQPQDPGVLRRIWRSLFG